MKKKKFDKFDIFVLALNFSAIIQNTWASCFISTFFFWKNEITQFFSTHSVPYMGKGTFTVIVNQTENKAKTASCDSQFFIPGFPASKLRAEKLVLSSYGRKLSNGEGKVIKKCIYGIKFLSSCHGKMYKFIYVGCLLVVVVVVLEKEAPFNLFFILLWGLTLKSEVDLRSYQLYDIHTHICPVVFIF